MHRRLLAFVLVLGTLAASGAVAAHHSTAMFDIDKRVTLNGVLKEFQWTNPHAWIQVVASGADGASVEWSIECNSPNTLSRQGWKPTMMKVGDKVSIVASPMKDGTHAGLLVTLTLPDGRVLGPGAASGATSR
jgi:hypothetical protein